jgi:hypothetical protein
MLEACRAAVGVSDWYGAVYDDGNRLRKLRYLEHLPSAAGSSCHVEERGAHFVRRLSEGLMHDVSASAPIRLHPRQHTRCAVGAMNRVAIDEAWVTHLRTLLARPHRGQSLVVRHVPGEPALETRAGRAPGVRALAGGTE